MVDYDLREPIIPTTIYTRKRDIYSFGDEYKVIRSYVTLLNSAKLKKIVQKEMYLD